MSPTSPVLWSTLIAACILSVSANKKCPTDDLRNIVQSKAVSGDLLSKLQGTYVRYMYSPTTTDPKLCVTIEYGVSDNVLGAKHTVRTGKDQHFRPDFVVLSESLGPEKNNDGWYSYATNVINGFGQVTSSFTGSTLVFYADENVIGYYGCDLVENSMLDYAFEQKLDAHRYRLIIAVKQGKVQAAASGSDPDVKKSLEAATKKLNEIIEEAKPITEDAENYLYKPKDSAILDLAERPHCV